MAGRRSDWIAEGRKHFETWAEQQAAEIEKIRQEAREAMDQVLGRQAAAAQRSATRPPSPPARSAPSPVPTAKRTAAPQGLGRQIGDQLLAGARGAQDAATFGLGDHMYAGALALGDAAHGASLGDAYARRMAAERARDQYDTAHYGTARTVGGVVGTGAQIAALGPLEGLAVGGLRMAQATPLAAKEIGALAGSGGAVGLAGQAISDLAQHRRGSAGDYIGAGVGGAVGALASGNLGGSVPLGPASKAVADVILRGGRGAYAGALAGGTTSVAQDFANGRDASPDRARDMALGGAVFGAIGGMAGRYSSNNLSRSAKEQLGERASRIRTRVNGDRTLPGPKRREYLQTGGFTYPDQRTAENMLVESKFGRWARLSKQQIRAYEQKVNYRVDHMLPRDIGALFGFPLAEVGYHLADPGDE